MIIDDSNNSAVCLFALCTIGLFLYEFSARASAKKYRDERNANNKQEEAKFVHEPNSGILFGTLTILSCSVLLYVLLPFLARRVVSVDSYSNREKIVDAYDSLLQKGYPIECEDRKSCIEMLLKATETLEAETITAGENHQKSAIGVQTLIFLSINLILPIGCIYWFTRKARKNDGASQDFRVADPIDEPVKNKYKAARRNSLLEVQLSSLVSQNDFDDSNNEKPTSHVPFSGYKTMSDDDSNMVGANGAAYKNGGELYIRNRAEDSVRDRRKEETPGHLAPKAKPRMTREYVGGTSAAAFNVFMLENEKPEAHKPFADKKIVLPQNSTKKPALRKVPSLHEFSPSASAKHEKMKKLNANEQKMHKREIVSMFL